MQDHVSKTQFKAHALALLRKVESTGNTVIVTDRGIPTIEVRQYRNTDREPLAVLKGSVIDYTAPTEPVGTEDWETLE